MSSHRHVGRLTWTWGEETCRSVQENDPLATKKFVGLWPAASAKSCVARDKGFCREFLLETWWVLMFYDMRDQYIQLFSIQSFEFYRHSAIYIMQIIKFLRMKNHKVKYATVNIFFCSITIYLALDIGLIVTFHTNQVIHDSYFCRTKVFLADHRSLPFPTQRQGTDFVSWGILRDEERSGIIKCPIACRPVQHRDWKYCWHLYIYSLLVLLSPSILEYISWL